MDTTTTTPGGGVRGLSGRAYDWADLTVSLRRCPRRAYPLGRRLALEDRGRDGCRKSACLPAQAVLVAPDAHLIVGTSEA